MSSSCEPVFPVMREGGRQCASAVDGETPTTLSPVWGGLYLHTHSSWNTRHRNSEEAGLKIKQISWLWWHAPLIQYLGDRRSSMNTRQAQATWDPVSKEKTENRTNLFWKLFFPQHGISLGSPGCPGSCSKSKLAWDVQRPACLCSWVLGLKAFAPTAQLVNVTLVIYH